ncbi:ATP-binding protein [Streptomyces sp. NPDC018693]|uniref:ATP-binding protein n=1 Tax=unclassified Streptomyces TaxID=2593676 RepID=UPI0037AC85AC
MGGIGKTALAVEAAHRACGTDWFPGGTLFVDLRGYDDNPVTADQAVLALLDALGVRGADLPPTPTGQYDAYGALLAKERERMLLILDNASDPSQYLPLLPGTDRHRVLITSRDRPDSLPVRRIDLDALDPEESVALVTRALRDSDERDDRPAREPTALRRLARLCGHLPLALQIAAAMLRRRRHRDLASLVAEIERAGDTAAVLDRGSPGGTDLYGRSLALRPVLETSYRRLPPDQARLLRLLAVAPGAETSTEAVAALTGLDLDAALCALEELAATHLVTPVRGVRWRVHDLVRAFGASVVTADAELRKEGEAARERVLAFYLRWATAADERLNWVPGMPEPERFADWAQALEWLDGERACLVAAAQWSDEERHSELAVELTVRMARYLDHRRYNDDWVTVARTARDSAHRAGNTLAEAHASNRLGLALGRLGRAEEAIAAHTHARDLFETVGEPLDLAHAWEGIGIALQDAGRLEEALDADLRALRLHRAAGNRRGEGNAWNHRGIALDEAGRLPEAIEAFTRAICLYDGVGDLNRAGMAWNNLGSAQGRSGRLTEAALACATAFERHQAFGAWYNAGCALWNLACAHELAGRASEARSTWLRAAEFLTRGEAPDEAARARALAEALPGTE